MTNIAASIDATGLSCPHPVLLVRAALRELPRGAVIELLADDPLASTDVQAFCLRAGHELLRDERDGEVLRFVIRKG